MVNEKSSEELLQTECQPECQADYQNEYQTERQTERQTEYHHRRASNQMSISPPLNDRSDQLYPSLKRSFLKDCKAVLDELLEQIETDRLLEQPSLVRFKEESLGLIRSYIDSASLDHSRALERSKQRSECMTNEIGQRIGLLAKHQADFEGLEADLLEYLGYL